MGDVVGWRMATLSVDLRQRILASYDNEEGTRDQIARRFRVSLGMVKKLLQQRRHTGCIKPRHHLAGRKPTIVAEHRQAMRQQLKRKPDLTLAELRDALGLKCTLPAIHYVLADMDLTYKKRHSVPASRTGPTSSKRVVAGSASKEASSRGAWSSSMRAGRRPT
jgi:transposase